MRQAIQIYERNNQRNKIEKVFKLLSNEIVQEGANQSILKKRRFSESSDENDQIQDILGFDFQQTNTNEKQSIMFQKRMRKQ
jgi:hypothetical protein